MRRLRLDPALSALLTHLRFLVGGDMAVIEAESTPWASATFIGARHRVTLRCLGADAPAQAAALAETLQQIEFDLPGHIVADAGEILVEEDVISFAALTLVEA